TGRGRRGRETRRGAAGSGDPRRARGGRRPAPSASGGVGRPTPSGLTRGERGGVLAVSKGSGLPKRPSRHRHQTVFYGRQWEDDFATGAGLAVPGRPGPDDG